MTDQHAVIPVSISTKARAVEMLGLLNALPDGPEKAKLMASDQVEEWRRHDAAPLRRYAHKVTTAEREQGYTLDPKTGEKIKFKKMGHRCDECGCVSQELKRHQKTAKCIKAVLENERLMVERESYFKKQVLPHLCLCVAGGCWKGLRLSVAAIHIPGFNDEKLGHGRHAPPPPAPKKKLKLKIKKQK